MNITPFGTTTTEEITELEVKFNLSLPQDYKDFLLNHNGGSPEIEYSKFYIERLKEHITLDVLCGIGIEDLDISEWTNIYSGDIPIHSIIIGHDPGNGILLLVNDGKKNGIYYYDHAYTFSQSSDEENTYFITETFTDFIESLKKPNED